MKLKLNLYLENPNVGPINISYLGSENNLCNL